MLHPELAAVLGAERFLIEIRTTANLQHPHILPLFDSGATDGTVFYVMPFVEGESLRDRLNREKQLPIDDAVRFAREVAGALDYAHGHGVIHRDIKPENILLHGAHALVADFGIALAASRSDGGNRMTETGMSLGTPHYMSPEQAMGERTLDARTDVYAVGCVLHEMLTGEPPFTGPTPQAIVAKVVTERAVPPSRVRDTVPAWLDQVVRTALEKLPADRYQSAARLLDALDAKAATEPAQVPSRGRRTEALLALVALAAAAAAAWGWLRSPETTSTPTFATLLPPPGRQFALQNSFGALSPDGRRFAFISTSASGDRQLWVRDLAKPVADSVAGTAGAEAPFWSPDGRTVGYLALGKVWLRGLDQAAPRPFCEAPLAKGAAWGSRGDIVITFVSGLAIGRADRPGCASRVGDTVSAGVSWIPTFFPDGTRFLITGESGEESGAIAYLGHTERPGLSRVFPGLIAAHIVASDLMVYVSSGSERVLAQRFDPERLSFLGDPVPLASARNNNGYWPPAAPRRPYRHRKAPDRRKPPHKTGETWSALGSSRGGR